MVDRKQLFKEINEISFTLNDLNLYLDTHPTDTAALDAFGQAMSRRKQLLSEYANQFEPLTFNCICPDTNNQSDTCTNYPGQKHFTWSDGPLPWEGGTV